MNKEYEIIELDSGKYAIVYYINGEEETREFYSYADKIPVKEIRSGYTLKLLS